MRTLSVRQLNRAVLARQLLLERAELPVPRALERVCGLQTQYAPTGYVGLWSRLRDFRRAALTDALEGGAAVQCWAMRCTIHMIAAADHAPFTAAVREPRREWWRRSLPERRTLDVEPAAAAVRGYLTDGPLKQAQIQARLADDGFPKGVWPGVQLWTDLVREPPGGTWSSPRAHVYGTADLPDVDVAEGEEHLARHYLRGFGPASVADVASFCGWTVKAARSVLDRLELRRFATADGAELVDVPRAPLPDPDTPAPVRFLGPWEAVLLVHARRAQVLPEEHRKKVFATSMPQSVGTFLVDGQVAGTWKHDGERVRVTPFVPLPAAAAREVDEEAERLTAWYRA